MNNLQIVCPQCGAVNRVPENRLVAHPKCGKCGQLLFSGKPLELSQSTFQKHLQKNDIPLLIDFWAPWCGPCKMMGPAFAEAATQLEPRVRLAKVNTEMEQNLGAQLNIRSIPTMVLFVNGVEKGRQSGAMNSAGIVQWVGSQLR
ncbi:MAG: thiol reductase thioredoxin [Deltaproteobacteria bacterium]|nr:MAG: thiol reductase thioredoxin [Deltaproteobacteria bacterium]RLB74980.1 MAG: thiol reductase thioredoxin [Deltaproteobacteria bacterium]